MVSEKVVSPVKTGVQCFHPYLRLLDSDFRRNDETRTRRTYCEFIKNRLYKRGESGEKSVAKKGVFLSEHHARVSVRSHTVISDDGFLIFVADPMTNKVT
jgi:hypothetical protein